MRYIRNTKSTKYLLVSLLAALGFFVAAAPALAIDPPHPPLCSNQLSSTGSAKCDPANNPPAPGVTFSNDQCYAAAVQSDNTLKWVKDDCSKTVYDNGGNSLTTVVCNDKSSQSGFQTPEQLCANHGGTSADLCATKPDSDPCHNIIMEKYIQPFINFLGIGFGIILTIMVVVGGIQYITSGSDPQKVAAAKSRISNAIFALVIFAFMYAILQWLVPGGIFQ